MSMLEQDEHLPVIPTIRVGQRKSNNHWHLLHLSNLLFIKALKKASPTYRRDLKPSSTLAKSRQPLPAGWNISWGWTDMWFKLDFGSVFVATLKMAFLAAATSLGLTWMTKIYNFAAPARVSHGKVRDAEPRQGLAKGQNRSDGHSLYEIIDALERRGININKQEAPRKKICHNIQGIQADNGTSVHTFNRCTCRLPTPTQFNPLRNPIKISLSCATIILLAYKLRLKNNISTMAIGPIGQLELKITHIGFWS